MMHPKFKYKEGAFLMNFLFFIILGGRLYGARPLSTDDAYIVEKEASELEIGCVLAKDDCMGEISIKHGITQRLDLGINLPYFIKKKLVSSTPEICCKYYILYERDNVPGISITFAYTIGTTEYTFNGIISKEIKNMVVHLNLGNTTYSGAMEFSLSDKLVVVGEIIYEDKNLTEILGGANFQFINKITFDFGISKWLVDKEWKITLGLTYNF